MVPRGIFLRELHVDGMNCLALKNVTVATKGPRDGSLYIYTPAFALGAVHFQNALRGDETG